MARFALLPPMYIAFQPPPVDVICAPNIRTVDLWIVDQLQSGEPTEFRATELAGLLAVRGFVPEDDALDALFEADREAVP